MALVSLCRHFSRQNGSLNKTQKMFVISAPSGQCLLDQSSSPELCLVTSGAGEDFMNKSYLESLEWRLLAGLALVVLFSSPAAAATTRTVSNLQDHGVGSLRDTIAASASGDTISFSVSGT